MTRRGMSSFLSGAHRQLHAERLRSLVRWLFLVAGVVSVVLLVPEFAKAEDAYPSAAIEEPSPQLPIPSIVLLDSISPSRYGPQRTVPGETTAVHAYSPFNKQEPAPCPSGGCDYVPGQVLVKLKPPKTTDAAYPQASTGNELDFLEAYGITEMEAVFPAAQATPNAAVASALGEKSTAGPQPDLSRWFKATVAEDADIPSVAQAIAADARVAVAEPDYLRRPAVLPDATTDPGYSSQWHLDAINAPAAWQFLQDQGIHPGGRRDVVVAVIDTGVDYTHPDLAANMWVNTGEIPSNGVDDDGNGYVDDIYGADVVAEDGDPMDDHGHGTHVAGIIGAQGLNGVGGVGVAYNVQLMAIKAAQYSGVLSTSDIAQAVYYSVEKGADVINMSFGGYARSQLEEDALAVAFGQAVLVAAAGNDGKVNRPCPFGVDMYPAAYNWVLGVMARAQLPDAEGDYLAGFSNYDCAPRDSHEYELMAPGVDVYSTFPSGAYAAWDGTSMAAPVVSGMAALVRSYFWDKNTYSSRFITGQIATTGPLTQAYTPLRGPAVSYHVPDAYAALTETPEPDLSYLEHWLFDTADQASTNDDDGIVDAGETIDLAIVIRNHWGKADNVNVTLAARAEGAFQDDPYVTMITDTVNYGAVGSFNWDDNGLDYDAQGAITGVRNPFTFTVSPDTPNDHVIPFLLTMTAVNGLDPTDTNTYTFQSRFNLIVQRGTTLPSVISGNLELGNENLWIVPDNTLIEEGVIVRINEGTQVQFGTTEPDSPYRQPTNPSIDVRGELIGVGTPQEPVEFFLGAHQKDKTVRISGNVTLTYVRIDNPQIMVRSIDHCYITSDTAEIVPYWKTIQQSWGSYRIHVDAGSNITNCIFHKMKGASSDASNPFTLTAQNVTGNLFERGHIGSRPFDLNDIGQIGWRPVRLPANSVNNVFLNNWEEGTESSGPLVSTILFTNTTEDTNTVVGNALLNDWNNPNNNYWLWVLAEDANMNIKSNFWGSASRELIESSIYDYYDEFSRGKVFFEPFLTTPPESAFPFVTDVNVSTNDTADTDVVGAEPVTFTVTFNRDMATTSTPPAISFGPDAPYTDFAVGGDWVDSRTWAGGFNVTPITGDGYQYLRVAGAVAADDPWLVTGDDAGRFRFEIITSGTEAMNLQATGGEGYVDLMWTQDDFDLLAGYNLYRSTTVDGTYTRLNSTVIPAEQKTYRDTNVQPGQPYYYKFTVVKTDMTESGFSNVASATPLDTILPVINHDRISGAPIGLPLQFRADVTDNVQVASVALFYRAIGDTVYDSRAMVHTTGARYTATLEGSLVAAPGLQYYIQASDGVSTVLAAHPDSPYQVTVVDKPEITAVSPVSGPSNGGTAITISGSNFKAGATVTLGGAVASDVVVLTSTQMTATTPPHVPAVVDVGVTNPDGESDTLLRGYTYVSEGVVVTLPDLSADTGDIVEVPLIVGDVEGLLAVEATILYDSAVLSPREVRNGALAAGFALVANLGTLGEIVIAQASATPVSGSGVLAYLEFDVIGVPGSSTILTLESILLNDGAIAVVSDDGSFTVRGVFDVTGMVLYYTGATGVPGVNTIMAGNGRYSDTTDTSGNFTIAGIPGGNYTLTPEKADQTEGAITAFDASLVLQKVVGLISLSANQQTAANVDKSASVSAMDASYILQHSAQLIGLPFPGSGKVWNFVPDNRTYEPLASDMSGQDFTAVLLGDVSGNWSSVFGPQGQSAVFAAQAEPSAELQLPDVIVQSFQQFILPLQLTLSAASLYGADIHLAYDSAILSVASVEKGSLAGAFSMAANTNIPGQILISMAGATPITTDGELLRLTFNAIGGPGTSSALEITQADFNEGAISVQVNNGSVIVSGFSTPVPALGATAMVALGMLFLALALVIGHRQQRRASMGL